MLTLALLIIFGFNDFNFVPFSTNTTNSDKIYVRTPRTQPGNVGKFSVFWYFCYVNNQIKTTTENLPTQPCCVPGVRTDSLSNFVAFVENGTKLNLPTPSMASMQFFPIRLEVFFELFISHKKGQHNFHVWKYFKILLQGVI